MRSSARAVCHAGRFHSLGTALSTLLVSLCWCPSAGTLSANTVGALRYSSVGLVPRRCCGAVVSLSLTPSFFLVSQKLSLVARRKRGPPSDRSPTGPRCSFSPCCKDL
ncbi:hypothetical protein QBC41DRAFT_72719 [Cercophora samala]|uniref:Secreted protein n=1 Tax=Cercophora samala TaxID=330535 RepID=A0AA39ZGH7_9PEZI|nr:hypothetical protein QBC41DRAFT_72719 [Cercophora samala]